MSCAATVHDTKISSKLGLLSRPDGSALFCSGETAVIAGVYGPVEVKAHKMLIDKATVEVYFRPKTGLPCVKDKVNEMTIRNICETALVTAMYPRSAVMVIIQEMQNYGDLLSCAINAAVLALLDTGIDLKYLVGAVSCALDAESTFHLSSTTLSKKVASFVFVFDSIDKRIVASHTKGSFSHEQYQEAVELCRSQSSCIFEFLQKSISNTK